MDNERLKSLHRGCFKIDEASLRSLGLSMSGPVIEKIPTLGVSEIRPFVESESEKVINLMTYFEYRYSMICTDNNY
jgi:hypothetical protein